jgi:hypothetical protein
MKTFVSLLLSTMFGISVPQGTIEETYISEDTPIAIEETIEDTEQKEEIAYDRLHQLYLEINSDMSYEEVLTKVKQSGLPYRDNKYNGSRMIKVAFDEEVVPHKYAKEGDHIEIHFEDLNSDNRYEEYVFEKISYWNNDNWISISALTEYVWGCTNEEDQGFFINNYKGKNNEHIKVNTKEEQLQYLNIDIPDDIHHFEDVPIIEEDDETVSQSPVNIPEDNSNNNNSNGNTTIDPLDDEIVYWTSGKSYHKDANCHNYVQAKYQFSGTMKECPKFDPCDDCCY